MKQYLSIADLPDFSTAVKAAIALKKKPFKNKKLGRNKTIGLLFFNPSLRTRISTQKAAKNLGMEVIVMNFSEEGWQLEFEDGAVMNQGKAEHIKEAAAVLSLYCDIIGVRAFASLKSFKEDQKEKVLYGFATHASVPVLNLESALEHPLQAFADSITLAETFGIARVLPTGNSIKKQEKLNVVLSWAPHPKALPHAVVNSFIEAMKKTTVNFTITHPKGYELDPKRTHGIPIEYQQEKALATADVVYVKNWSNFTNYGVIAQQDPSWTLTPEKIGPAKCMHCLPVRRNIVISDGVLDGPNSLVMQQANNRTFAAQWVLQELIKGASL